MILSMNLKARLHDYFYDKVYNATDPDNLVSHFVLRATTPVLKHLFPIEKNTRSPEEILESLGYDPKVFENASEIPVRIFSRNLGGLLALSTLVQDISTLRQAYSPKNDAVAFFPAGGRKAVQNYIILNDKADYKTLVSNLSGLPETCLTGIKGNRNLSSALTLAHELTHFDLPTTSSQNPAQGLFVESLCDGLPLSSFKKAADPDIFEGTYKDLLYGRAIWPILTIMEDKCEVDVRNFGHATALILENPDLLEEDNAGQIVVDAYIEAKARLDAHMDWDAHEPRIVQVYKAAQSALSTEVINPNARRAIELYLEGMGHLAPDLVSKIHRTAQPATQPDIAA